MALIVEDGSIVTGANSYIDLTDARAFLASIGQDLPAADEDAEQALIRGNMYVNSFEDCYQGDRISAGQTGSFPRSGVYINGFALDSDEIPQQLKDAQCFAAYEEGLTPGATMPNNTGQVVTMEEVTGAVKVQYADNGAISGDINFTRVDSAIAPLKVSNCDGLQMNVFRG